MKRDYRRGCLIRILIFLSIFLLGLCGYCVYFGLKFNPNCNNFDRPYPSPSIKVSKDRKAFIRECRFDDIIVCDSSYQFPFGQAWEEITLLINCDEKGKTIIFIDSLEKTHTIVLRFKSRKDSKIFQGRGKDPGLFIKDHFKSPMTPGSFSYRSFLLPKNCFDSTKLSFTIYKRNTYSTREKDYTPLFKFNLYRDAPDERNL